MVASDQAGCGVSWWLQGSCNRLELISMA